MSGNRKLKKNRKREPEFLRRNIDANEKIISTEVFQIDLMILLTLVSAQLETNTGTRDLKSRYHLSLSHQMRRNILRNLYLLP